VGAAEGTGGALFKYLRKKSISSKTRDYNFAKKTFQCRDEVHTNFSGAQQRSDQVVIKLQKNSKFLESIWQECGV